MREIAAGGTLAEDSGQAAATDDTRDRVLVSVECGQCGVVAIPVCIQELSPASLTALVSIWRLFYILQRRHYEPAFGARRSQMVL